jgi:hypothetical protein
VEASDDEDDIFSAADILENNELLPLFLLPVNYFSLVNREGVYTGLRCEGVPAIRYPELSGDRPVPAKISFSGVRYQ